MKSKALRTVLASIALVSLAGFTAPAEAAPKMPTTMRNVWCC
jgi:hypothetical protein